MTHNLHELASDAGGLYLTGDECLAIVGIHKEGEQRHDAARAELKALRDKLGQISCLAFDDGRLNRKLLCSLVDELEGLLERFNLPPVVDAHEYIANIAYDHENAQERIKMQYNAWLNQRRVQKWAA
jgi:hypothetical protein